MRSSQLILALAALSGADALAIRTAPRLAAVRMSAGPQIPAQPPRAAHDDASASASTAHSEPSANANAFIGALALAVLPSPVAAAGADALPSAFAAYGHYLALITVTLCLATERLTIKPGMSAEEEDRVAIADAAYGVAGLVILVSGYYRATEYGKGWYFYSHEPIFWLKMTFVAVMGAASFFPTTKIIQRAIARQKGEGEPMSEKLAARMTTLINAELLMILSIPLAATTMARGIGYVDFDCTIPGGLCVALALFGLGGKYVKEALDWEEDAPSAIE